MNSKRRKGKKGGAKEKEKYVDAMAEFAKLTSHTLEVCTCPLRDYEPSKSPPLRITAVPNTDDCPWDALRKSITGIVNRANVGSIKHVVSDLFSENFIRSRRLFARSTMKAQTASSPFLHLDFAALV